MTKITYRYHVLIEAKKLVDILEMELDDARMTDELLNARAEIFELRNALADLMHVSSVCKEYRAAQKILKRHPRQEYSLS